MMIKLAFTAVFILFTNLAISQTPDWLLGNWSGSGTLFGQSAEFEMVWTDQWKGKFLALNFSNQIKESSYPKFEVKAFYQPLDENSYKGYWFDSRGRYVQVGSTHDPEAKTLTSVWGEPSTEQGRTIYQWNDDGTISVQDFVLRANGYELFGEAMYQKQ